MSGIVGVFMRNGAPADHDAVAAMAVAASHRAADGAWKVRDGCFSAIRQLTFVTPEDEGEGQPVSELASGVTLLFDGRLDNRDELIAALGLDGRDGAAASDSSIALHAWRRWGEETPRRLLGDFAFVVWNAVDRSIFCARDPMGVRPLFYFLSDAAFVFGSELRQVLAHPLVPQAPDETTVADLLRVSLRSCERTLYRDVRRLPHGHAMVVSARGARTFRHWMADVARELALRDDGEYAEAFRDVFDRAVAARLRSRGAIGAYLSGGLDSSSVLASVHALRAIRAPELTAFSLIFPGHPETDERQYSEAALRRTGVAGVQIAPQPLDPAVARAQVALRRELPDFPNDLTGEAVRRAMALRGIRVALTGSGGDYGLSGSYFQYADFLRRGRIVAFARRYRDVARDPQMRWTSANLLTGALWPLLPVGIRRTLRPLARRMTKPALPPWIHPALAARTGLGDPPPAREIRAGQLARADVIHTYENGWAHLALDAYQRGSTEWQIEDRHPFFDRRVVEFVIALPDEQRWQRGTTKYVLRRAMTDRLPPVIRDRPDATKAEFSHLFAAALDALGGERFFADDLEVANNGWIVPAEARALYGRMRAQAAAGDMAYADAAWQLWIVAAIELWYAGVFINRASGRTSWKSRQRASRPMPWKGRAGALARANLTAVQR